ncbi:MAG TPA: phosphotransferase [bacterium]|nr:phosphotransferase [bacterium]
MIALLERTILANWKTWEFAGDPPRQLEFLLSSGPAAHHGKILLHVFREKNPTPLLVVKIPRQSEARAWVRREHEVLRQLAEEIPDQTGALFPRAVFLETNGQRLAAGQAFLSGWPADRLFSALGGNERAYRRVCGIAFDWLSSLWSRSGFLNGIEGALWHPFREAAAEFTDTFEPSREVQQALDQLSQELDARREGTTLTAYAHGDLIPSNLIVQQRRVGAVDWELGTRRQFPWVDPVHFAISFSLLEGTLERRERLAAFTRAFLEKSWQRDANLTFLRRSFEEGGVAADLVQLAIPMYCVYFAVHMSRLFDPDYAVTRDWAAIASMIVLPQHREQLFS